MLVRLVIVDKREVSAVPEKKFDRFGWWAYIWLERFDKAALKFRPREYKQ